MSKKFKSQASSARAADATFGSSAFGFGSQTSSSLSYIAEQPDLSAVSDPNVIVSLRNLGKKDSTTKSKALEDLQEHVKATGAVEETVISAWTALYPRTSIDNSRRVRQLAHSLQGSLTSTAGKRIGPHLPKVVGPWLSALFDNDRSVARTAQEALVTAFNAQERRNSLWKRYRTALVEYAEDAILVQTAATLSDERSTSKDDSEAKYSRVVGSAMLMLAQLIKSDADDEGSAKDLASKLETVVTNKRLWEFVYSNDPHLRRGCCVLAMLCAQHFRHTLDPAVLSTCFVAKALTCSQLGSSGQYVEALLFLTGQYPSIWTTEYHARTSAAKKLLQFLARGSQRGPEAYWKNVGVLIQSLPREVISQTPEIVTGEDAIAFVAALREGLSSSEEPRQNLTAAWSCYLHTCFWLQSQIGDQTAREAFISAHPLSIPPMLVNPLPGTSLLPPTSSVQLATIALMKTVEANFRGQLTSVWNTMTDALIERMKISLPETSKDFATSQDAVVAHSARLQKLKRSLLKAKDEGIPGWAISCLQAADRRLVDESIDLLKKRNGKPYGAAVVLQEASLANDTAKAFLDQYLVQLLDTPSAERLLPLWEQSGQSLAPLLQELVSRPRLNAHGENALASLLSIAAETDIEDLPEIEKLFTRNPFDDTTSPRTHVSISAILQNPKLASADRTKSLTTSMVDELSSEKPSAHQVAALAFISKLMRHPQSKEALTGGEAGNLLLAKLLLLTESHDSDISQQSTVLLSTMKSAPSSSSSEQPRTRALISQQLSGALPQLSVLSIVDLAVTEIHNATNKRDAAEQLMPSEYNWENSLRYHESNTVPHALNITSPLQGAVYAVTPRADQGRQAVRDGEGLSQAFRLTIYVSRLDSAANLSEHLDEAAKQVLTKYLPVALQLVNEKLTLESANDLWLDSDDEVLDEAADVLSEGNSLLHRLLSESESASDTWLAKLKELVDDSLLSYHVALACTDIINRCVDQDGPNNILNALASEVKSLHKSNHLIQSASVAACFRESLLSSDQGKRLLNELIADATELKSPSLSTKSLRPLMLLNILLGEDSEPLDGIPSQRLVFLMQSLVRLLTSGEDDQPLLSEIFKLLSVLLLAMQDIYGDHWQQVLDSLLQLWNSEENLEGHLPVLHASLRLYQKLKTLAATEDANEDLTDAWKASNSRLEEGLLQRLILFEKPGSGLNQPRQITARLLGRLLSKVDVKDATSLYKLMSSREDAVLAATYGLLHRAVPKRQEDLSLEFALEKQIIKLPPELLAFLADTPNVSARYSSMKRWLLCWQLAFDHFENASYKLREAYLTGLKSANVVPMLLDRICDLIRIAEGRPVDASKFKIDTFNLDTSESEGNELQWLAIHLYYRSLLFTPSLAKAWFIEQKNRIRAPLESWTQKHMSSFIVSASFATVAEWASTQDPDDNAVTVKANVRGFELVASMEIDTESPPISIAVTIPSSYPLNSPSVISRTRVAVSEKNWQSWLRTFQIIIFSTGSIVEGLVAFRRNVQGAIKGQGECAICYSIIGTDMQTPNKRCGTCKNTFHGSCLFRWFKSSNSSSCPLCRNNFNYA